MRWIHSAVWCAILSTYRGISAIVQSSYRPNGDGGIVSWRVEHGQYPYEAERTVIELNCYSKCFISRLSFQ